MTDILKQLDEAEKAATPGPWGFARYYNLIENDKNKKVALLAGQTGSKLTPEGHLIILMRNNIRALIDVAKAAEKFSNNHSDIGFDSTCKYCRDAEHTCGNELLENIEKLSSLGKSER